MTAVKVIPASVIKPDVLRVAAYCRVSSDSADQLHSYAAQIRNYTEVIKKHDGWKLIDVYADDGVSGTTFERSGFQAMIADMEAGRLSAIIVNDFYARDTSRKIKAIFNSRMSNGKRVSPSVPYGYLRDPEDKQHLIVDPEPAAVVRRIFQMVIDGYGVQKIADTLTAEKVLIPSAYAAEHCPENNHSHGYRDPCFWSATAVGYILEKQEYMGHTVLGKTVGVSYKTKKRRKVKPEELKIFRNTHEAIVDEETWNLAHKLKRTIRKSFYPSRIPNPLTGLLFCADCGAKMSHALPRPDKAKVYDADDNYRCSRYRTCTENCTMHFIKTSVIRELILTSIREISEFVRADEQGFLTMLQSESDAERVREVKEQKKELRRMERRIAELDGLVKKLYEGNAAGRIPDKHFSRLLDGYDKEQSGLEKKMEETKAAIAAQDEARENPKKFIELVKKYTDFSELTTPMLNEFIEKILVHEADKSSGERRQKVDIYFNFIGNFTLPKPEPDEETLKEEARKRRIREQKRISQRRRRAAKKAELEAADAARETDKGK